MIAAVIATAPVRALDVTLGGLSSSISDNRLGLQPSTATQAISADTTGFDTTGSNTISSSNDDARREEAGDVGLAVVANASDTDAGRRDSPFNPARPRSMAETV